MGKEYENMSDEELVVEIGYLEKEIEDYYEDIRLTELRKDEVRCDYVERKECDNDIMSDKILISEAQGKIKIIESILTTRNNSNINDSVKTLKRKIGYEVNPK